LSYIDFEGRTDSDSAKKLIVNQIRPKQLVLVHGSAPATRALTEYYQQSANMVTFNTYLRIYCLFIGKDVCPGFGRKH
jgi:hypothetical protein